MCFSIPRCCKKSRRVANKSNRTLRKECFTNICPNTSFFYWLIMLWIFLIVLSIGVYGVLLVGVLTLDDPETSEMIMNIVIHIVNGLFTFAAFLNLPVRCRRLWKLYRNKSQIRHKRKVTLTLFPSYNPQFTTQSTDKWEEESTLIFDRLAWGTQHVILQALLWNSLFQIINQAFRCVYYSYELADTHPGIIFVNTFFPLAILASVIASLIQAVAENRFRDEWSLGKKPNNLHRILVHFWHNLWKVQAEGNIALAHQFGNRTLTLMQNQYIDLRARTFDVDLHKTIEEEKEDDVGGLKIKISELDVVVDLYSGSPVGKGDASVIAVLAMIPSTDEQDTDDADNAIPDILESQSNTSIDKPSTK